VADAAVYYPAVVRYPAARWLRRISVERAVSWAIVAGALLFTLSQLHPGLLLADTTPTGGDTGAQVYAPAYLRDHLLPSGRLSGWAPGWYAGFPLYQFYPVVPALLILVLDILLPYGVALKLVTVSGILLLPIAAWAAARLADLRFPTPAVLAVSVVPFLFDQSFSIWGGNIQSTLAGEFSFSLALSLALLSFGLLCRALRTGRGRAGAAAMLGLTFVCHPIVALYAGIGTFTIVMCHLDRRRLRDALLICAVAGALSAFWVLPFVARSSLMSSMGYTPLPGPGESALTFLAPSHLRWIMGLAAVGGLAAAVQRNRLGLALAVNAGLFALMFPRFPESLGLWNARLLPFYYLCIYLLAGLGVVALARLTAAALTRFDAKIGRGSLVGTAPAVLALVVVLVGMPLRALPGGRVHDNAYSWLGLTTTQTSAVPASSKLNYGGYEQQPAWPEYHAVMERMADVGRELGCGRAEWEYDQSLGRYGTPDAMMLLPYWTGGCIDSMEGLYYESSGTTPFHFLTVAEHSEHPGNPMTHLPYGKFDLEAGIAHMRLLGVRYYMAFSTPAVRAAGRSSQLRPVAVSGPWHVYELSNSSLVSALAYQPAVTRGADRSWRDVAVPWFKDYPADPTQPLLAASGPQTWQRVEDADQPHRVALPPVEVTDVRAGDFDIRFRVDRIGIPVLVKTSYFPNWSVSGAKGPFRATPNSMVVVPTSKSVHLHYGYTAVDGVAYAGTMFGLLGLVLLRRRGSAPYTLPPPGELAYVRLPRRLSNTVEPEGPAEPGKTDERSGHPVEDR